MIEKVFDTYNTKPKPQLELWKDLDNKQPESSR